MLIHCTILENFTMLRIRATLAAIVCALTVSAVHATTLPNGAVYSANEGDGSISEITLKTGDVRTVQISVLPHNVKISPDGTTLLAVGASVVKAGGHATHGSEDETSGNGNADSHAGSDAGLLILNAGQLDKTPQTLPAGSHPSHIVTSSDGRYAYITNADTDRVSVVDIQGKSIIAEVATGGYPHGLRLSPDGRELYVANVSDNSVSVIDSRSLREAARISVGKAPVQVAFTPDGKHVYVSLRDEDRVAIIDTSSRKVVKTLSVGRNPIQLYAAAGGSKMYVANQGSDNNPDDRVSVIDTKTQTVIATVVTGKGAHGVVANSDGGFVFITNTKDNTVSAIDTSTEDVVATYSVGPNPNGITYRSIP